MRPLSRNSNHFGQFTGIERPNVSSQPARSPAGWPNLQASRNGLWLAIESTGEGERVPNNGRAVGRSWCQATGELGRPPRSRAPPSVTGRLFSATHQAKRFLLSSSSFSRQSLSTPDWRNPSRNNRDSLDYSLHPNLQLSCSMREPFADTLARQTTAAARPAGCSELEKNSCSSRARECILRAIKRQRKEAQANSPLPFVRSKCIPLAVPSNTAERRTRSSSEKNWPQHLAISL